MKQTIHLTVDTRDADAGIAALIERAEKLNQLLEKANSLRKELASSIEGFDAELEIEGKL